MVARIQRTLLGFLATLSALWFYYSTRSGSYAFCLAGLLLIPLGYAVVLGLEFALLRYVRGGDATESASIKQLIRAWFTECKIGLRVFAWWQPFRSDAVADALDGRRVVKGRRGLILVHGFFCNRGFWTPWIQRLNNSGHAFVAVNLEPVFGSIDAYVSQIEHAVVAVTKASGLPPVIVCHSMGGLAVRVWVNVKRHDLDVHRVVTIGTPHHGTWLARFGLTQNSRQMRPNSEWMSNLILNCSSQCLSNFTCWYSNCDNIVYPASNATLPEANNRLVLGAAHVELAFRAEVMNDTIALLTS